MQEPTNTIESQFALAMEHHAQGRLQMAFLICRSVLEIAPNHLLAWNLLAVVSAQMGNFQIAIEGFRRAIQLAPGSAQLTSNLANAYAHQGMCQEAIQQYESALRIDPSVSKTWSNLGDLYVHMGNVARAKQCYEQSLQLEPSLAETWCNYAKLLDSMHLPLRADQCFVRSLQLMPNRVQTYLDRAQSLANRTEYLDAMNAFERAIELDPNSGHAMCGYLYQAQQIGCWLQVDSISKRLVDIIAKAEVDPSIQPIHPYALLTMPIDFSPRVQQSNARRWVAKNLDRVSERSRIAIHPQNFSDDRIRLGYISGDFRPHPMATLVVEMLENHNRDRFQVHGYSVGSEDNSPIRKRIQNAFESFVDLEQLTHEEAANRIASDGIQILVDLSGFTYHARPEIVAMRPAPIQVSYMGFAGTMGAAFIDYVLLDDFIAPMEDQEYYTEKIVQLPGCYMANDSQRSVAKETPSRMECNLPEGAFVFCSFNNSHKITQTIFRLWMNILRAVPNSVLWLLESNRWIPQNLKEQASRFGVAPNRLVFGPRMNPEFHLARHRHADLFLDTYPYGAHTTASDSLWMGCPVVTLVGKSMISRVAGSLLRALELDELVTLTPEEYQRTAIELAKSPQRLKELKVRLLNNRHTSSVFDGQVFAKNLETALAHIWNHHRRGRSPEPFAVQSSSRTTPEAELDR